jgi:hypothetical protein
MRHVFHLNQPAFPVDTYVWRTTQRLGLKGPNVSVDLAHTLFAKVTPPEWVYPLHINLIRHWRQICRAQRPACKPVLFTVNVPMWEVLTPKKLLSRVYSGFYGGNVELVQYFVM